MTATVETIQMTRDEALELTQKIAVRATDLWELVKRAYTERAWAALGYSSWDAYVDEELGMTRLKLPREDRHEVVTSLHESGLSVRAIAAVTGDSKSTVSNVIREDAPAQSDDVEPVYIDAEVEDAPVTVGTDGKEYKREPVQPKPKKQAKTLLTVQRPDPSDVNVFPHGATAGFGDPDLGAAVVNDMVQWFAAGSYDDIEPGAARFLAACLLAAAETAEAR